ncbi:hypothetical protein T439DRAFT_345417 [Meredithblackwellia eburnea MCA 4105]
MARSTLHLLLRALLCITLLPSLVTAHAGGAARIFTERSETNGERFKRGLTPRAPAGFIKKNLLPLSCYPAFTLLDTSETSFNPTSTPFTVLSACGPIDPSTIAVTCNDSPVSFTTPSTTSILVSGQGDGLCDLKVYAELVGGAPVAAEFKLVFGGSQQLVSVVDINGNALPGATVTITATSKRRNRGGEADFLFDQVYSVATSLTTNANGQVTFTNIPQTTLAVLVTTVDNQSGAAGFFTGATVIVHTTPFGTTGPHRKRDLIRSPVPLVERDATNDYGSFVVDTNNQYTIQTTSKTITIDPTLSGERAYLTYAFTTSEFPGGYYGSSYNDFYGVTIRTNLGQLISQSGAMNSFAQSDFSPDGTLPAVTLSLDVTGATSIEFDVGVSNVGDNAYQSHVTVSSYGDTVCGQCPQDPTCADSCQNPTGSTCTFFDTCAEAKISCGRMGYSLAVGKEYCLKLVANIPDVSAPASTWLQNTNTCLQKSLLASLTCTDTCASIAASGSQNHADCYSTDDGNCSLSAQDWAIVVPTLWASQNSLQSFAAAWQAGNVCSQDKVPALFADFNSQIAATSGVQRNTFIMAKDYLQSLS